MKVLILGSGGREHALAWAVKRSQRVTEVVCAPGNGGIAQVARCVPVDLKDVAAMVRLAEIEQPSLTIVGPELPLSLGVVDAFRERGFASLDRPRNAARLESSKAFAKQFMKRHQIPTANYAVCTTSKEVEKSSSTSTHPSSSKPMVWRPARASSFAPLDTSPLRQHTVSSTEICSGLAGATGRHRRIP